MSLQYVTIADLETVISEQEAAELALDTAVGTIDFPTLGDGDPGYDSVLWALGAAESLFDSYASKQYGVPLASVTTQVKQVILTVAKYNLFLRRSFVSEHLAAAYDQALSWLRDLSRGLVEIPIASPDVQRTTVSRGFADATDRDALKMRDLLF